ncbi:hypothetical protein [Streptomyces chartreusis]|uniref:Helix-turn-helix domain-containing protein n=1 Tax=Streptomyces chartreusis TaxID=1969 RepID=A0A7H8T9X4_STRCX|nr:hypothetical protein [Streptomyces chartreusis]QKZ20303.1 hypothetical protein HUT05_24895 [Streptomyces chartreusis]
MSQNPVAGILQDADAVAIRRVRREEARGRHQRTASAQRRADYLKGAADCLGSQQAVADRLGTSGAAVSKAITQASTRPTVEELPITYIEVELATAGDAVLTADEWRQLPEGDKPAAAHVAESAWRARARLLQGMLHTAEQTARAYGEVWYNHRRRLDQLTVQQMHEELREEEPGLPDHLLPSTAGELAAAVTMATEAAESLRQQLVACWAEQDRWRDRQDGQL